MLFVDFTLRKDFDNDCLNRLQAYPCFTNMVFKNKINNFQMELDYTRAMPTFFATNAVSTSQNKTVKICKSYTFGHVQHNLWYTTFDGPSDLVNTMWVQLNECCALERANSDNL